MTEVYQYKPQKLSKTITTEEGVTITITPGVETGMGLNPTKLNPITVGTKPSPIIEGKIVAGSVVHGKVWDSQKDYDAYTKTTKQTPQDMVKEFHESYNCAIGEEYKFNSDLDILRYKLVKEEFNEVIVAHNPEHLLKELADLVYVAYGYAVTFGWDLDEAFRRVHISNMSKLDPVTNKPVLREDGKVLKGPDYKEPDLKDLV